MNLIDIDLSGARRHTTGWTAETLDADAIFIAGKLFV
jgi:hypothetical protein